MLDRHRCLADDTGRLLNTRTRDLTKSNKFLVKIYIVFVLQLLSGQWSADFSRIPWTREIIRFLCLFNFALGSSQTYFDMRMTDSSSQNSNDSANGSHGKRPAQNTGPSGGSFPKIVKFNGNVYRPPGRDSDSPSKRPAPSHYSREDLLSQRQALPIFPVRQR